MTTNFLDCHFSPDRAHRYTLKRTWDASLPVMAFIGLNPSTADETCDDPTIRRCCGYAKDWGYGGLWMGNIFAYRATDPRVMKAQVDPVGPLNDEALLWMADQSGIVVAAWGNHGAWEYRIGRFRTNEVKRLLKGRLHALKLTGAGQPNHPLYLKKDLKPFLWA